MALTKMPRMTSVMTPFPYSVESGTRLSDARQLMREHDIHHLPVKRQGELVGVVSDRDLRHCMESANDESRAAKLSVEDARVQVAPRIDLHARLDEVAEQMAETRSDAVLILRGERLAGIFTATDACRCLAEYLGERFPHDDEDQIA